MTSTPLLSVVIPTYKRPQFLPRAIDSALQAAPDSDVEVIVVPNGPDESWKTVAEHYKNNQHVKWEPIAKAHACAARNHGKKLASGKYLRFLDDDDYLLPPAVDQLLELERSQGEICSGLILNVDMNGNKLAPNAFPETTDFVIACTQIFVGSDRRLSGFTLPGGNVFLRGIISSVFWDETVARQQDNVWMLDLASSREWLWVHLAENVAVWAKHGFNRISDASRAAYAEAYAVGALKRLYSSLSATGRLNNERRSAIAQALWCNIFPYFPYRPLYCHGVAKAAREIDRTVKPDHNFFSIWPMSVLPPLLSIWIMLPAWKIYSIIRDLK